MKKNSAILPALIFTLTGCSSMSQNAYIIYFGNMYLSADSYKYDAINQKAIQNNHDKNDEQIYYTNIQIITEQSDVDEIKQSADYVDNGEEIKIPDDHFLVYFFAQIPSFYQAVRRENIQYINEDGQEVLVTDNFYQLSPRPNMFYCFIDLEFDITISRPQVFSFYYYVSDAYLQNMTLANIRVIFSE